MERKWAGEGSLTLAGNEYAVIYVITRTVKGGSIRQGGCLAGWPRHMLNELMNAGPETLTLSDGRKVGVTIVGVDPREPVDIDVHGDLGE